ncbi:MAG: chemotaxis protein CheW [Candidatus Hydrogenedentes bacterium]|nr:chemotaxis protein CheW [Candidatus Hydrogenedentota bacterium]
MSEQERNAVKSEMKSLSGKYLTFKLAKETYGIQILKVQEIIGLMSITSVPRTPDFVRGVINLRGKVIPVIELRKKFGMESIEDTDHTCIIVVQVNGPKGLITMGVLVDEVSEVIDISDEQLEPAPSFGTNIDTAFILAMGKLADAVVILLDIDKVLTTSELSSISSI